MVGDIVIAIIIAEGIIGMMKDFDNASHERWREKVDDYFHRRVMAEGGIKITP
jgi:hypothetical protein